MHARVTTVSVHPGKLDETASIIQTSVAPVMKQQQGFKGWLLLTDSNKNKVVSITLWETISDMTEGELSGYYQDQIEQLIYHAAGPHTVEHFEVRNQFSGAE